MKHVWMFMSGIMLLGGCATSPGVKSSKGIITDATMNTVTVVDANRDTLSFSTLNADRSGVSGLLLGDSLEVFYTGKYKPGMEASKIVSLLGSAGDDEALGEWEKLCYEGVLPAADCPGIKYRLEIRHREHSGDGRFSLSLTYLDAENGRDTTFSYTGRRFTQRGIPADKDATVWQLITDEDKQIFNFLCEDEQTLTLLNDAFEKSQTGLNYTLKRVE